MTASLTVLKNSSAQFLCLIGVLFVSGFVLTLISRWTNNSFRQFRFPKSGLWIFGIVGIPLHELSHALFAKIFFHKVKSIKWFDPAGKGGSYGTVVHFYDEKNLYHRIGLFFIGMGPVLLAPFFLMLILSVFVPTASLPPLSDLDPSKALNLIWTVLTASRNWTSASFYLFLYLAACLTSQMELSADDFKIARGGILPIFLLILAANTIAALFGVSLHAKASLIFTSAMTLWSACFLIAILISVVNFIFLFISLNLANRMFGLHAINPFKD